MELPVLSKNEVYIIEEESSDSAICQGSTSDHDLLIQLFTLNNYLYKKKVIKNLICPYCLSSKYQILYKCKECGIKTCPACRKTRKPRFSLCIKDDKLSISQESFCCYCQPTQSQNLPEGIVCVTSPSDRWVELDKSFCPLQGKSTIMQNELTCELVIIYKNEMFYESDINFMIEARVSCAKSYDGWDKKCTVKSDGILIRQFLLPGMTARDINLNTIDNINLVKMLFNIQNIQELKLANRSRVFSLKYDWKDIPKIKIITEINIIIPDSSM